MIVMRVKKLFVTVGPDHRSALGQRALFLRLNAPIHRAQDQHIHHVVNHLTLKKHVKEMHTSRDVKDHMIVLVVDV